jgi:hypothetical protein
MDGKLMEELKKSCDAKIPYGLMFSFKLESEIGYVRHYLAKKYHEMEVGERVLDIIKEIEYSINCGFNDWFERRVKYYENKWEKDTQYKGPIIDSHNFVSETFKILDCTWWVQNAYQPYSSVKKTLEKLDSLSSNIEKSSLSNKKELIYKAKNICGKRCFRDLKALKQSKMDKKEHESERKLFSFFAELLVYEEIYNKGFKDIKFLPEQKEKQPDLIIKKENGKTYVEVKQIREPLKEDDNLRSYSFHSGFVNQKFRESLKKKIGDFICDAKQKFKSVKIDDKESRVIVIDFQEGIDTIQIEDKMRRDLVGILGKDFFNNLEVVHNMTILTRKYF